MAEKIADSKVQLLFAILSVMTLISKAVFLLFVIKLFIVVKYTKGAQLVEYPADS